MPKTKITPLYELQEYWLIRPKRLIMNPGTFKNNAQKGMQAQDRMKSASDGGVPEGGLQMLHVHVFLAAPLGAGHMAESGTDQHEGRIAIGESAHHPGAGAPWKRLRPPFFHLWGLLLLPWAPRL